MVASTVTIPIFAKLADLYGRKRIYLGGMFVFLIGSALSETADSMTELVTYRALQGLGAIIGIRFKGSVIIDQENFSN